MPSKKQRAKAAKIAEQGTKAHQQTQPGGHRVVTLTQATRASTRAAHRVSAFRSSDYTDDQVHEMMEAVVMSKPGITTSTFAHDGRGSQRLLRERMQQKLQERRGVTGQ